MLSGKVKKKKQLSYLKYFLYNTTLKQNTLKKQWNDMHRLCLLCDYGKRNA